MDSRKDVTMIPKFRVWDKTCKCMCNVDMMNFHDKYYKYKHYGKSKNVFGTSDFSDKSLILMQSTGLLDKNGVEIYEGDILLSKASENQEDWKKWRVHYADGRFLIDYKDIPKDKRKRANLELEDLCEDNIWVYGLKVIGNIYENPRLMEVE